MDESWRMQMGVSNSGKHRRRRSVGGRVSYTEAGQASLEPEDFDDVFGGPPKSVLARKLSVDFTGLDWFYQEMFQPQDTGAPVVMDGRRLPGFSIPQQRQAKQKAMSMSKSKSTSSSVLSFEEMSELGTSPPPGMVACRQEDVALSSFTSRLRPINIPSRWRSSSATGMPKTKQKKQELPAFGCTSTPYMDNNHFNGNECNDYMIENFNVGFSQAVPSSETILEQTNGRMPVMGDYDMQLINSPSSGLSSVCQGPEGRTMSTFIFEENMAYQQPHLKENLQEETISSSYVIELNSRTTEANNSEAIDIDEAIAWAKEKFQG